MKRLLRKYGIALAFLILAFVGGYAVQHSADSQASKLYRSQLASCKRGNVIRSESNNRIKSHEIDRDVLAGFLADAERARKHSGTKNDRRAARQYAKLRQDLKRAKFFYVAPIDCTTTVIKP